MGRDQLKDLGADDFDHRREVENAYTASHTFDTVAANGGTVNFHVRNPAESGRIMDVEQFVISSQFRGQFWIYDAFTSAPSGGTALSIDNLRMDAAGGAPDDGYMDVFHGVTFSDSGTHFEETLPSGGGSGSGLGTTGGDASGTEPLIEPGREIVIELQNDSSNDRPGTIGIVYTERSY